MNISRPASQQILTISLGDRVNPTEVNSETIVFGRVLETLKIAIRNIASELNDIVCSAS